MQEDLNKIKFMLSNHFIEII